MAIKVGGTTVIDDSRNLTNILSINGTVSSSELSCLDGVVTNIQSQLNNKAPINSPSFSGTVTAPTETTGVFNFSVATGQFVNNNAVIKDSATGAAALPSGTVAQRPATPSNGQIRYNSEYSQFEGYKAGAWSGLGGATGGAGNPFVYLNDNTITQNYTIPTNYNGLTAGPITINNGVTITVADGAVWTVV